MTTFTQPPETIKELDVQLDFLYKTMGRPETWKEERERLIELYELEDTDAE
jgi:hypothetical protein